MTKLKLDEHYSRLLSSVKERIRKSQYEALKAVNKELIGLYLDALRNKGVIKRVGPDKGGHWEVSR